MPRSLHVKEPEQQLFGGIRRWPVARQNFWSLPNPSSFSSGSQNYPPSSRSTHIADPTNWCIVKLFSSWICTE